MLLISLVSGVEDINSETTQGVKKRRRLLSEVKGAGQRPLTKGLNSWHISSAGWFSDNAYFHLMIALPAVNKKEGGENEKQPLLVLVGEFTALGMRWSRFLLFSGWFSFACWLQPRNVRPESHLTPCSSYRTDGYLERNRAFSLPIHTKPLLLSIHPIFFSLLFDYSAAERSLSHSSAGAPCRLVVFLSWLQRSMSPF